MSGSCVSVGRPASQAVVDVDARPAHRAAFCERVEAHYFTDNRSAMRRQAVDSCWCFSGYAHDDRQVEHADASSRADGR
ncbi:hypothetical protein [Mycetohabitans sp. B46]|uniref:hypothetical protein n=1 Tax=Mycetohabitans sp. B46 TaxID=2772536 RepID=UPI00307DA81C